MAKLQVAHPRLWKHLFVSLRTGTRCSYVPEQPTEWQVT